MSESPASRPESQEFIARAREFCHLVSQPNPSDVAAWCRAVEAALLRVHLAATLLPDVGPAEEGVPGGASSDLSFDLAAKIGSLLGAHDAYRELFDPTDPGDIEPVPFLLSVDLAEIFKDLQDCILDHDVLAARAPSTVVWGWRFGHRTHWGRHATSAIRVLGWLNQEERLPGSAPPG
ncbi:MAG: DUF5063 domain-containing protein [Phycisphaerales bacterium]